ncbi:hypothetical protein KKF82_04595 [Patescibacteria group bacterium]|nr:hypothetical protein [Patescibacteria group bacterium]
MAVFVDGIVVFGGGVASDTSGAVSCTFVVFSLAKYLAHVVPWTSLFVGDLLVTPAEFI